jgi:nicotinate dehydrogenase subunit B
MSSPELSRRQLLEGAGLLVVGFATGGTDLAAAVMSGADVAAKSVAPESLDSWLAVARDGTVTLYTGRVDKGTRTLMCRSARFGSSWAIRD